MVEKVGGRKAAACLTGLVVIVGCFLLKGVIPSELVESVQYLVTTYLAGNVMADVVQGVASVSSKRADAAVNAPVAPSLAPYDDSAIQGRLAALEQALGAQATTLQQVVNHLSGPNAGK